MGLFGFVYSYAGNGEGGEVKKTNICVGRLTQGGARSMAHVVPYQR